MSKEQIHVVTDLPAPKRFPRVPVKKVALATAVAVAAVLAVDYARKHTDVTVETVDSPEA